MGALFTRLFQWLYDLGVWIFVYFINLLIDLINAIIKLIAAILQFCTGLLPSYNFNFKFPTLVSGFIENVNWFVPLCTGVTCLGVIALFFVGYFTVRPVLKFFQLT